MSDPRWEEDRPSRPHSLPPSRDLLDQIVSTTEDQMQELASQAPWDVAATEFAESVRRDGRNWQDEREIVGGMVRAAMPEWSRAALSTPDAYEDLIDGVARALWSNLPARDRIVALYQQIRSSDQRAT